MKKYKEMIFKEDAYNLNIVRKDNIYGNCSLCGKEFKEKDLKFRDFGSSFYYCVDCRNKSLNSITGKFTIKKVV